ncbi:hypothetical protein QYE76_066521 [Lolium multiflorum]|uniref:Uncharacterized protein n=1 Tax=Lolium multiflorum TaxID=4521 RepID=A0AAD8SC77_LOLMU|nr:hypothetical protein QYE76_066521 [Lolium multiflorum]
MDIFAWQPSDMSGVPRELAEHYLNINPGAKPVKQAMRRFGDKKHRAIGMELAKLLEAGATYQRTMQRCLKDQIGRNVHAYVDDIAVMTRKGSDLISDLTETFENLRRYKMMLNPLKCVFGVPAGKLLGFIVSHRGIEVNPEKIKVILSIKRPTCLKDVQRLTGCVAAISRFVSRLGEKALPLYKLLKKTDKFVWDDAADAALQGLKDILSSPPILASPSESEPMLLYMASSNKVVSLVIVVERQEEGIGQVARLATAGRVPEHLRDDVEGPGPPAALEASRLFVLLNHCSPVGFGRHILARPVGQSSATTTSTSEMAEESVKYEDLPAEHKKKYDDLKAILEADLIGAFEKTRSHGIKFKGFQPEGALEGLDLSLPSEERTRALRQEVNYAVAHSLHRHSESLVNTLERVALNVVQEIMKHKYSPSGPALGTHQGEIPLYTRPPLQYTFAAPQQQGSPAYVVYKVGGDPGDYQFLYEPPKEIPHGYVCTYVPDCNNWANQITAGGVAGTGGVAGAGSSSGADVEKQAWLAKYATGTSHERSTSAAPTVDQITAILRDQFGILPKKRMIGYSKPYPNEYDLIPLPPKYRLPDFTKFSGSEGTSSIEHVSRYLAQLGMVSASDELRVRFFSQSLTGPAFGWYTSLLPDSVRTWKQLEEKFHIQYHSEATEAGIADLTQVRQRRGEMVSEYIQRFRTVRNRCYSVRLSEKEACELAIAGLSAPLKDVTFQAEYNSLAHMVQKLTSYEQRHPELYQDKYKRVALIETDEDEDSAGDQEVAVAEWTRGQNPCPASG